MLRGTTRTWIVPAAIVAALACALAGAARAHFVAFERELRGQLQRELAAVADLKVEQIAEWRQQLLDDAGSLLTHPFVHAALVRVARGEIGGTDEAQVTESLRARLKRLRLSRACLVSLDGRVLAATSPWPRASEVELAAAGRARREGAPRLDPLPGEAGRLVVALPIPDGAGRVAGTVLLEGDVATALPSAVRAWPTATRSGEILFGALDGEDELFLEPLRHVFREAVPRRLRSDPERWALARAARGERGDGVVRDYRGVAVIEAWRPVPAAPWAVAVKVDEAELLEPAARRGRALAAGVGVALIAAALAAAAWWRSEQRALERRALELEARGVRQRLDYLWSNANDLVFVAALDGELVDANERAVAALAGRREALARLPLRELAPPEARAQLERELAGAVERGSARFETLFRRADGSTFPVELVARVAEVGDLRRLVAVARDVSERKQVERLARLQGTLLRHLSDAVVAADRELRVTAWTGAAERIYGRSASAAAGLPLREALGSAADPAVEAERRARVDAGGELRFDDRHRRADGASIDVEVTWAALRDDAGAVVGYLAVSRDVTEQRRLQAQLVFADRLASIGTLAAGVAHEINNPLSYLLANFEFLEERLRGAGGGGAPDGEALAAVREARDGARRISEIVRGLRTFSRADAGAHPAGPASLTEAVRAAVRIAERQLRPKANLVVELADLPPVAGSEHELAQVALNLLVNAAHAIPEGRPAEHTIRVATSRAPDGRAALEVSDTGAGIAPEHLARIFDPFFTTKPVGEGSGLGLAICHGIVETLGGEIEVRSTVGRGTRFRVLLPARPAEPAPAPAGPTAGRRGRVLVLDDEALVCRAVARTLRGAHEVVALTEPAEALARLERGEPFDVVLCDLMMPGLSGMECYEALRARRPELAGRMIFLTGGAFTPAAREFLERVPNLRVEKPFDAEALRQAVARCVELAGEA
ncbi:ATP-binding response regulator [Anaeromyxobacter diazotrophicus]|uniref:histidine kinase n=1 Tax=Anaeromyxobacter diazotrophicus TaxID=2590199 RepID=A0A7I9VIH4_9BACT|nr:ATP-binding protein [Anaeromyxobacter diazotrophicus]GEJ56143.1 hypothetical protein AMYX_08840 [Anaeromyxobacter diazotrophicus]